MHYRALFRTGATGAWHPWYFELLCNGTREIFTNFWLTVAWHPWNFEALDKWHPWIEGPESHMWPISFIIGIFWIKYTESKGCHFFDHELWQYATSIPLSPLDLWYLILKIKSISNYNQKPKGVAWLLMGQSKVPSNHFFGTNMGKNCLAAIICSVLLIL